MFSIAKILAMENKIYWGYIENAKLTICVDSFIFKIRSFNRPHQPKGFDVIVSTFPAKIDFVRPLTFSLAKARRFCLAW